MLQNQFKSFRPVAIYDSITLLQIFIEISIWVW